MMLEFQKEVFSILPKWLDFFIQTSHAKMDTSYNLQLFVIFWRKKLEIHIKKLKKQNWFILEKNSMKKETKSDLKYWIFESLICKLNNANSNGCNADINNLHPMVLFFFNIIENSIK